jgi:hypothetical protein
MNHGPERMMCKKTVIVSGDQFTLNARIATWLSESGYSLEMSVARGLQSAGFSIVQSEYFEDSESEKWRETDILAYCEARGSNGGRPVFSYVVECKGGKHPWVLFTAPENYPFSLATVRRATSEAGRSILGALQYNDAIINSPLFEVPPRTGYGLSVAFRESGKPDPTFDGLNSVCRAAIAQIKKLESVTSDYLIPFAWPTIVINVPLFECYLDDAGEPQVEQITKGTLIWKNPMITRHTIVQIYTADQFLVDGPVLHAAATEFVTLAAGENDRAPRVSHPSAKK